MHGIILLVLPKLVKIFQRDKARNEISKDFNPIFGYFFNTICFVVISYQNGLGDRTFGINHYSIQWQQLYDSAFYCWISKYWQSDIYEFILENFRIIFDCVLSDASGSLWIYPIQAYQHRHWLSLIAFWYSFPSVPKTN